MCSWKTRIYTVSLLAVNLVIALILLCYQLYGIPRVSHAGYTVPIRLPHTKQEKRAPSIDITDKEAQNAFVDHSIGPGYMWYMREPSNKLLYCFIPKNGCTIYKTLMYAMTNHDESPIIDPNHIQMIHRQIDDNANRYKSTPQFIAQKLLNDASWNSFVILRDPLERLVSGFKDKCVAYKSHWCEGEYTSNFTEFAQRIVHKINTGNVMQIHDHYRPQYTFCGLDQYFEYFDYVIYFDKTSIANDTKQFMNDVGIQKYYQRWGKHHNETMFSVKTAHAPKMDGDHNKMTFYSQYYDQALAHKVIEAFKHDYARFNMKVPQWVHYL